MVNRYRHNGVAPADVGETLQRGIRVVVSAANPDWNAWVDLILARPGTQTICVDEAFRSLVGAVTEAIGRQHGDRLALATTGYSAESWSCPEKSLGGHGSARP